MPEPSAKPSGETTFRLLEQARTGDPAALEHLFARCLPLLRRWARGRLPRHARDLADTQDLVQDVLTQALKRLKTFESRGPGAFQAYLRQAFINRTRDELRRAGRRGGHDEVDSGIPANDLSPLEAAIGRDAVDRYERSLARLTPEDRNAIVMRLEMGCSYDELTDWLGKPTIGAARKAVERALVRLASEMSRDINR